MSVRTPFNLMMLVNTIHYITIIIILLLFGVVVVVIVYTFNMSYLMLRS